MSGPQCLSKQIGDRTECALLQFSLDLGEYYPFVRDNHPEDSFFKVFKFSVERKTMTTVVTDDKGFTIYSKGAPEVILQRCNQIVRKNGDVGKFLPEDKLRIDEIIKHMQEKSHLKVLCLAYRCFYPLGKCMNILGSTTGTFCNPTKENKRNKDSGPSICICQKHACFQSLELVYLSISLSLVESHLIFVQTLAKLIQG